MALDVGYFTAVGAGALSFLSPCVLPLVPPYLCYMAGVSVDDFRADAGRAEKTGTRNALLATSLAFVLGFSTVFVALAETVSTPTATSDGTDTRLGRTRGRRSARAAERAPCAQRSISG